MTEPTAWHYERDSDKALSFVPDRADTKHWQPLYTEAQLAERHARILHDICHAYGKAGECILTTFKYRVNT